MKRIILSLLLAFTLFGLAACSPDVPASSSSTKPAPPTISQTVSTPEGPGKLEMILQGDAEIRLEFGAEYQEPGAMATYYPPSEGQKSERVEVTTENNIDFSKLGTYKVRYHATYGGVEIVRERIVHIVDTTVPVIELKEDGKITLPGQPYEEAGFTAKDNYDGDITHLVQREEKDGVVYYTVSDSSGNQATAERPIAYGDETKPTISLLGADQIVIQAGVTFVEPGYSALDGVDGDLTDKVKVEGKVDHFSAGIYTLIYKVSDSHGNEAQVQRIVVVEPIRQPDKVTPDGKVIYLTFDDGPSKHTERLLEVLNKYNAKATFFVVKTGYLHLLPKIAEGGHAIGIHSVTHDYKQIYSSKDAFFKDLYAMQDIIYQRTGIKTTLMRFPGGSSNTVSANYCKGIMSELVKDVTDQGFQYFDWNGDSNDAGGAKTSDEVYNNVIKSIGNRKRVVVLQHDIKGFSVDAVERIIIWGLQNGYTFQALTPESPSCHHGVNN